MFPWKKYVYWRAATVQECSNAGAADRSEVIAVLGEEGELLALVGNAAVAKSLAEQNDMILLPRH